MLKKILKWVGIVVLVIIVGVGSFGAQPRGREATR